MRRTELSTRQDHPELQTFAEAIRNGRFFRRLKPEILLEMLRQGNLIELDADETLLKEGRDQPPQLAVLLEGSLVVVSQGNFLMRLDVPGDVAGEMSIITRSGHPFDVIAEAPCRVVTFPEHLFREDDGATEVSILYLIFSHILSEKLRITAAQSLLGRSNRPQDVVVPKIALLMEDAADRQRVKGLLAQVWDKAQVHELASHSEFLTDPLNQRFDLFVIDPLPASDTDPEPHIRQILDNATLHGCPILALSAYCESEQNRRELLKLGASDFLPLPCPDFDLEHQLSQLKLSFYRQRELEKVEEAADTDRLTGMANRRKLDEFMEALVTLYPEERKPFSLIIADVDNFKHYNDTHGHQMGDVVLATVASIFKARVRRGDLAARFGGEEFVMMLPKCNKDNALKIAEKLRKAVEDEDIPYQEQQPLGNLTATFGAATYPDDADTLELLLKKADECLYVGKEQGRNCVIGATPMH
jgi:diguanylate cyclase (GGDEF)-like protein